MSDEVVGISRAIIYGDPKEAMELLCTISKGHIHTAYAERINLTFRNHLARFIRKTMNFSEDREIHTGAVDFFQAWYNFVKPHDSMKLEINLDMEVIGFNLNPKKWIFQTPVMAELITDHIWTMKELMICRAPIQ